MGWRNPCVLMTLILKGVGWGNPCVLVTLSLRHDNAYDNNLDYDNENDDI